MSNDDMSALSMVNIENTNCMILIIYCAIMFCIIFCIDYAYIHYENDSVNFCLSFSTNLS